MPTESFNGLLTISCRHGCLISVRQLDERHWAGLLPGLLASLQGAMQKPWRLRALLAFVSRGLASGRRRGTELPISSA